MGVNKYLAVEQHIKSQIEHGILHVDDRLPSIRQLSIQLSMSKNTVIRAYQELEATGLIYSVPKSGYRVKQPETGAKENRSQPKSVDLLSVTRSVLSRPAEKLKLLTGSAHPSINNAAVRSLYAEIGRHSRLQTQLPGYYQLPPGNDQLVKQLLKISHDLGVPASANEIAVTHGAQQAISLALRALTQPGDIVVVESPCYFGNLLLLESLGLKVLEIPGSVQSGIDIEALKEALDQWPVKALVMTPNFANPTGSRMPLANRKSLLEATGSLPIIEDDVFGSLAYDAPLPSLKELDNQGRVIYVNSLSKTLDSRLRVGWLLSGQYQQQIEKFLLCDNMGSSNLMQSAVGQFLTTGRYRSHIAKMKRLYQTNQKQFYNALTESLNQYSELRGRYHLSRSEGAFLVWLTLPETFDSYQLYLDCNQHKLGVLPGTVFGTHDRYKHCVRFSVANLEETKDWRKGVELLAKLIAKQCQSLLQSNSPDIK
ncbi:PLP-dependent aminotransferase family protein [Vibrio sp. D404a]|uniref:aminotransferase-like domain-containing protein n=1 Tax=unclassified Vibrio TaxID=2614977 RepID=UPI0025542819|nr:PLP-dependent aminotransferase family protein [Vibrio sp. D404a]MDK9798361.1 PLP-dependent aminotransferase family protein [Vibrio sp. D449a]